MPKCNNFVISHALILCKQRHFMSESMWLHSLYHSLYILFY